MNKPLSTLEVTETVTDRPAGVFPTRMVSLLVLKITLASEPGVVAVGIVDTCRNEDRRGGCTP